MESLDAELRQETGAPALCRAFEQQLSLTASAPREGLLNLTAVTLASLVNSVGVLRLDVAARSEQKNAASHKRSHRVDLNLGSHGGPQVRDFVKEIGIENLGKRLVNSKEGKVEFERPKMNVDILLSCVPRTLNYAIPPFDGQSLHRREGPALPSIDHRAPICGGDLLDFGRADASRINASKLMSRPVAKQALAASLL